MAYKVNTDSDLIFHSINLFLIKNHNKSLTNHFIILLLRYNDNS